MDIEKLVESRVKETKKFPQILFCGKRQDKIHCVSSGGYKGSMLKKESRYHNFLYFP
jgi:hypothetical protein